MSSAASAGGSAIDHVRDWVSGSDQWLSMGVPSDGSYGIPLGLIYSYPVLCKNGKYEIIKDLPINGEQ